MASSSSSSLGAGGSKRKRLSEEFPALPAPPKRPSLPPAQQDFLALPAPKTPIRGRHLQPAVSELNVLLPDGNNVILHLEVDEDLSVSELVRKVKRNASKTGMGACSVNWGSHVYLEDRTGNRIEDGHIFDYDESSRILFLQDGQPHSVHSLQDMWNVTPDPELLVSLPQEYTVETALADLLDNSLQAVWANLPGERRFISVTLRKDKITIFDSGPGMDSTSENSIAKWGTMGSSKHRSERVSAIGGKPPFLQPYFGMYGFGGLTAAMHLGGVAVVSSKTKLSKKVVSLTLEKEKLMERCKSDRSWKTAGEYREPTQDDLRKSPHGSFTKVELSKLKKGVVWTEKKVMCMLKDIYFPYIQCDAADSSQGTMTPVEFQVNETNLTEVDGGEVALTNMSSCNGTPFVLDIHMKRTSQQSDPCLVNDLDRATARIKCLYFPIKRGKESIENILDALCKEGMEIKETFDNFCRVSIRRLGRLLPDARWRRLPFMEPKRKRGDKTALPKICFERVKAFIDTDAGFVPTTSKMDLLSGHIFTSVLKNLGTRGNIPGDVIFEIYRGTKLIKLQEMEKEYEDWIREMHDLSDEEVECENEPYSIAMANAEELGLSQKVYRIYEHLNRKGRMWKQGMRIRFYKGVPGYKTTDLYATLEYFLADGLMEDRGNTKVICRPIDIAKAEGSRIIIEDGEVGFELQKSKSIPIEFLTLDKCEILQERDWIRVSDNKWLHEPGDIDILDPEILQSLGLDGGINLVVKAGVKPFDHIYTVIRPNSFVKLMQDGRDLNPIDQKNIVKKSMQMRLELRWLSGLIPYTSGKTSQEDSDTANVSMLSNEQSINNIHGFYCFRMDQADLQRFYTRVGRYTLTFSVMDQGSVDRALEKSLEGTILPSDKFCRWSLEAVDGSESCTIRVGSEIGPLMLHCWDEYDNVRDVNWPPDSSFEVWSLEKKLNINLLVEGIVQQENKKNVLIIKALKLTGGLLRGIAEDYSATLKLVIAEKSVASMKISVFPGEMSSIQVLSIDDLDNCLQTGDIIHRLTLQMLDMFGNHVEKGCKVVLHLDNLELQDSQGHNRMVDDEGCIRLGGLMKVTGPFNARANISVYTENQKLIYYKEFFLKRRVLRIVSNIPEDCVSGGILHDIVIEIVDENGNIDKTMTGGQHFLLVSYAEQSAYPLREGSCSIKSIQLPDPPGPWCCHINHVMYQELRAEIKLNLVSNFEHSMDFPDSTEIDEDQTLMVSDKTGSFKVNSGSQRELEKLAEGIIERVQDLKKKMKNCLQKLEKAEAELENLNAQKKIEVNSISQLEGEIEYLHTQSENAQKGSLSNGQDKNEITAERVAQEISKTNVPAKFFLEAFCSENFLSATTGDPHIADILGVVCLLASAKDEAVSRALAEFIGQESMLAVVCRTHAAADILIRLKKDGSSIDETWGLYNYMRSRNHDLHGKIRVYILEDMRWYTKGLEDNHPQKLLRMDTPKLGNGLVPNGFLGYAVNLLHLNDEHLEVIGREDHGGLRGSLFYSLLQELQVYDTCRNLFRAKDALTTGGVSLDGGIIRDRGCADFGQWDTAKILFPLHSKAGKKIPSLRSINHITKSMQIRDALREKRKELQAHKTLLEPTEDRIDYVKRRIKARQEKYQTTKVELEKANEELTCLTNTMKSL